MIYLDSAATTIVDTDVINTVCEALKTHFANPSALYLKGMQAGRAINEARGVFAACLGCDAKEIYFTASGSESNNIAILGSTEARKKWADNIVVTGYEHPSVLMPAKRLSGMGYNIKIVMPNKQGEVLPEAILEAIDAKTALVCAMQVNNEIGSVLELEQLSQKAKAINPRLHFHVDGIQGFLKLPFSLKRKSIDSYACSGHKLHAPKGVGALYIKDRANFQPVLIGGGQEKGVRAGTENTAYILAFAKAVSKYSANVDEHFQRTKLLKELLLQQLAPLQGVIINSPKNASPYIVNFSVIGCKSEPMLHFLESRDIMVSAASACSKGEKSHTLRAMNLSAQVIDSALRVSFSKHTAQDEIFALVADIKDAQKKFS